MDAISGAVQSRIQRQVAPALTDVSTNTNWHNQESTAKWGISFLPYASTFSVQTASDLCGNIGTTEGILPLASASGTTCTSWSSGTVVSPGGFLIGVVCTGLNGAACAGKSAPACTQTGTELNCTYWAFASSLFGIPLPIQATITATAPAVAGAFRAPITISDISASSPSAFSLSLDATTGAANLSVRNQTAAPPDFFPRQYTVRIPNLPDASILSDSRLTWFINNGWHRYAYYAVSPAKTVLPGASTCPTTGGANCLTVSNLPSSNGLTNDKVMVLTLMGKALTGQTQPSDTLTNYLETHTVGSTTFTMSASGSTYNDRHAPCPYKVTYQDNTTSVICQ